MEAAEGERLDDSRALKDSQAQNKLEVIVLNLVALGQWEAAKGLLNVLARDSPAKAKHILESLILSPQDFW